MTVTGIGGFFFRARDPQALGRWYAEQLGIGGGDYGLWQQEAGDTVFAPFPQDTDYFAAERGWMLNLRVDGLDALLDRLRAAGTTVLTDPSWDTPETGRFARIHDPEGNPIELWEPPGAADAPD
ncbi:MAG: VOC family protein [Sphingomonadaceae bacterium]|nr:VOC family protein [Sphingomonadaceae bacterium]